MFFQLRHAKNALWLGFLCAPLGLTCAKAGEGLDSIAPTSTQAQADVLDGYLKDETLSLRPELGVVAYKDSSYNETSRVAEGIGIEWNAIHALRIDPSWYVGISSGTIYSNLGDSHLLFIPVNMKEGYNFTDHFRLSVHGGGNVIYRSVAGAINLSTGGDLGRTDSVWRIYPNLGADLDIAFAKNLSMFIRPDFTLAPSGSIFVGAVGLGIGL